MSRAYDRVLARVERLWGSASWTTPKLDCDGSRVRLTDGVGRSVSFDLHRRDRELSDEEFCAQILAGPLAELREKAAPRKGA